MILVAHRGNIHGKLPERENSPSYIDEALALGYDVELDIWYQEGKYLLGHDNAQYSISLEWLLERKDSLWVHCKSYEALSQLLPSDLNIFYHTKEPYILTSKNYIWAFPGYAGTDRTICLLPEYFPQPLNGFDGICSDFIGEYNETGIIRSRRSSD